jgi:hypothetical protein
MKLLRLLCGGLVALLPMLAACDSGGSYQRKGGQWRFDEQPISVADPASFKPLGRHFAHDKWRGYYLGVQIDDSEGSSFQALSAHEARDARQVYWAETYRKGQEYWSVKHQRVRRVAGADAASYRSLGQGYGRDVGSAYHEGRAFAVRDPATFEVLDALFTRDARRAYFERSEIAGSDGASFALIDASEGRHARDRSQVWYAAIEIPAAADAGGRPAPVVRLLRGASPATVQVLGRGYARDGARLWWRGQPVADADAASFAVNDDSTQDHDAQDARGRFAQGVRQRPGVAATANATVSLQHLGPATRHRPAHGNGAQP